MISSGTRLIPDGFCYSDPLEELSILENMLLRSMSYSVGLSYYSWKLTSKDDILKMRPVR